MRIAVTGSTGLVGTALVPVLRAAGHEVRRFVRTTPQPGSDELYWQPNEGRLDPSTLSGVEAVVHLSGENLGQRWTDAVRHRIRESRVRSTEVIATAMTLVEPRPGVLITASAVGIYGDRGDELLDERSTTGDDFLGRLGREWEGATAPAARAGIRVAHTRSGVMLSPDGGMLARVLPIFRMGAGGRIGSGKQWLSWVALPDALRAILFLLERDDISGAVNVVAPEAVTNAEFTRTLGKVLGRPTITIAPAFGLKLVYGEMADATILASQRADSRRLREAGFEFRFPRLEDALREVLGVR